MRTTRLAATLSSLFLTAPWLSNPTAAAELESVIITGGSSTDDSIDKPLSVFRTPSKLGSQTGTLGDALQHQLGISSTQFGPNASRPVIRGQDSDRIRILRNSVTSVDASALSFDHALPFDLLSVDQLEVIRGPAALAYGGNAVGGAVNVVDFRIPRQAIAGNEGELNLLTGGGTPQTSTAGKFRFGGDTGLQIQLDGFRRHSSNTSTPAFTDPDGIRGRRIQNSSAQSEGGGFGTSWVGDRGYTGVSVEEYQSQYGVPKALDVRIRMDNTRYALEGQQNLETQALTGLKYRLGKTQYQHQEFEQEQPATRFANTGTDGRLELNSHWGDFGFQWENSDFSAQGAEAFVPNTSTHNAALFYLGQTRGLGGVWNFGLRAEQVRIEAQATGLNTGASPVQAGQGFAGPADSRGFTNQSASLAYSQAITPRWTLTGTASYVERAPSSFELYADGLHVATQAYELGNPALSHERGKHLELGSVWRSSETKGAAQLRANAFVSRYSNYIALLARTGANAFAGIENEDTGAVEQVQVFDFMAVPARFHGAELEWSQTLQGAGGQWTPRVQLDWVKGERTDRSEALPRITPARLIVGSTYTRGTWTLSGELIHAQRSTPGAGDSTTPSYTLVNASIEKNLQVQGNPLQVFLKLNNLGDELAYSATTVNTVRDYAPLAGRSALAGVRYLF